MSMDAPPIPESIHGLRLLIWFFVTCLTSVGAIATFLLLRFIKKNDDAHAEVKGELKKTREEVEDVSQEMRDTSRDMKDTATQMHQTQLSFQTKVNSELLEIGKSTTQIKGDLRECQSNIAAIGGDVRGLTETMEKHQKSLSLGAQAIHKQRERMDQIETTIKKVNDRVTIIGQRTKKKEDKS